MSEKMTCPGCDAHTSTVLYRFRDGEPCPYCGLSAGAAIEIMTVRSKAANQHLMDQFVAVVKRADKAEERVRLYQAMLQGIQDTIHGHDFYAEAGNQ